MTQYLVQMSGVPGSGKSTIAEEVTRQLNAIVVDHDDTKSAILSTGIENDQAGQASYEVIKAITAKFLGQGFSVIIDSPCLYRSLLEYGISTARKNGAEYRYIECKLDNLTLLNQSLLDRGSKPSQIETLEGTISHKGKHPRDGKAVVEEWASNMKRPESNFLVLDTAFQIEECMQKVVSYILDGI
jgi:predicted kinase